MEAVQDRW